MALLRVPDATPYGNLNHPGMLLGEFALGSLVIDVNNNRLDATFLRETGAIDDHFTILKGAAPESLKLCTFQVKNSQTIARWKSIAGQTYQVERTSSLENPHWLPASVNIRATGATTSWTNAVPNGDAKNFYRVVWPGH